MEPGNHAEEAYGYTFESLLMKAHEMGLGTVWIGGTMPRVVVDGDRGYFYIKHDRGYDNGTYDLQKIDIGIAMYHFERQLVSEGKSITLEISDPNVELPKETEYIASFRLQ